jgi:hypothetical protein
MAEEIERAFNGVFGRHYTVEEAARISRMSIAWWRMAIFQRRVDVLRIGRRVFVPESTLIALREKSMLKAVSQ